MRFSYSQVSMYESNPWKHFCNYVLGLYPPSSEQADRGTDVHSVFEEMVKYSIKNKDSNLIEWLDKWHENSDIEEGKILGDETWTIVRRYLLNYAGYGDGLLSENRLPWRDAKSIECEKKVLTTFGNIDFVGYIDLVVHHEDGSVTLYDYKTLSNKPSVYEYTYGMQGNLYIAAMQNLGYTVREFVFDAMNPKMNIPWNGYKFFRIELPVNPNVVQNAVNRFVHLANEIIKNPSYHNTFGGWGDQLHIDAWREFIKGAEHLVEFCTMNGVNVATSITESVSKGYPVPYFFVVDGPEYEEYKKDNSHKIKIIKKAIGNRKKLENWSNEDIIQEDELDFDFIILCNSHGCRMFNNEYSEVNKLNKEEIDSLEFGEHYYEKL